MIWKLAVGLVSLLLCSVKAHDAEGIKPFLGCPPLTPWDSGEYNDYICTGVVLLDETQITRPGELEALVDNPNDFTTPLRGWNFTLMYTTETDRGVEIQLAPYVYGPVESTESILVYEVRRGYVESPNADLTQPQNISWRSVTNGLVKINFECPDVQEQNGVKERCNPATLVKVEGGDSLNVIGLTVGIYSNTNGEPNWFPLTSSKPSLLTDPTKHEGYSGAWSYDAAFGVVYNWLQAETNEDYDGNAINRFVVSIIGSVAIITCAIIWILVKKPAQQDTWSTIEAGSSGMRTISLLPLWTMLLAVNPLFLTWGYVDSILDYNYWNVISSVISSIGEALCLIVVIHYFQKICEWMITGLHQLGRKTFSDFVGKIFPPVEYVVAVIFLISRIYGYIANYSAGEELNKFNLGNAVAIIADLAIIVLSIITMLVLWRYRVLGKGGASKEKVESPVESREEESSVEKEGLIDRTAGLRTDSSRPIPLWPRPFCLIGELFLILGLAAIAVGTLPILYPGFNVAEAYLMCAGFAGFAVFVAVTSLWP